MHKNPLVGTWTLVSFVAKVSGGEEIYPWGHDSTGHITYTSDGYVFLSRMSPSLRNAGRDLAPGSVEEAKAVVAGFEAYSGRYAISDNMVTHNIEICSLPMFCGTQQKRYFELKGDELSLTTEPVVADGIAYTAFLVWRKATLE